VYNAQEKNTIFHLNKNGTIQIGYRDFTMNGNIDGSAAHAQTANRLMSFDSSWDNQHPELSYYNYHHTSDI